MTKNKIKTNLIGLLFALPWIIGFFIFGLYPIFKSLYYSFTDFNIFMEPNWIGLDNYKDLFQDRLFYKSLSNTLFLTVIGTPVTIVFALVCALLLNMEIKARAFFRTIFFLPSLVPIVAATLMWVWIFNPKYGLLNMILRVVGLKGLNWLADPLLTKPSLILIGLWTVGVPMIIFLAALQDVPRELYEAASIDGATEWRKLINITLPSISHIMLYLIILAMINNFQYFTQAYVITGATGASGGLNVASGGPANSILFYALYLYHNAFVYLKMGKASAMAWILFIIAGIATWLIVKTYGGWSNYEKRGQKNAK